MVKDLRENAPAARDSEDAGFTQFLTRKFTPLITLRISATLLHPGIIPAIRYHGVKTGRSESDQYSHRRIFRPPPSLPLLIAAALSSFP